MENKHVPVEVKAAKPTLMGRPNLTPVADDGNAEERILANLKIQPNGKPASKAGQKSSTFKTLAVLGLGAVAAFFGYQYVSGPAHQELPLVANQSSASKATKGEGAVIEEKVPFLPQTAASAPVAAAPEAATEAAQIVNEPSVTKAAPSPNSKAKPTAALDEGVKPPKVSAQKVLEAKETSKRQPVAKPAPAITANEKNPTVVASKDKDVNLLAALLTHNNTPVAPIELKQFAVAKNNPTMAVNPASTVTAPEKIATEPATASAQATESQLKKCGEFGFFERELCRMKTCNNLWETNAACKATLSPIPAVAAEAQKR